MNVFTWIEQRTGFVSLTVDFLTEDVPGGASYWYVFGSATLFAMILQFVTGIFLTFYYAPSSSTAWESTNYIYHNVPLGWFVISLHYWGATAMIALLFMHMLQVLVWGAYKAPREIMWLVGVILFIVTLVLGLTGYLLPWDMNAYFASQVAINIASSAPIVGNVMQQFLSGGAGMGTLTINRFFGLHVWLMPALIALLAVVHLIVFRHNGSAGPPTDHELRKLPQGRFWPNQMFMDAFASFAVFVVIVVLSIFSPAPFDVKADPSQAFIPYPAWYFLALYGMLRVAGQVPAALVPTANLLATIVIPTLVIVVLVALPWLDRKPSRQLRRRTTVLAGTAIVMVIAVGLSAYSQLMVQKEQAETPAPVAAAAAATTGGSTAAAGGAAIYATNCAGCHNAAGTGTPGAFPPLAGNDVVTGDPKKVIHVLLYGLSGPLEVKGQKFNNVMPAWKGTLKNADIAAVATYIRSTWGNKASAVTEAEVAGVPK